jgi:hypothetical protein
MVFLSFKWLSTLILTLSHPFYVSVTEINHNAKDKSLEITCKMFTDDLEQILKKNYKVSVDLGNQKQQAQNDKIVSDYIKRHLVISADGKAVALSYVGYEKDVASVFCYLEVTNISGIKKLDALNSILQDFNEKQINIMHVMVGGNRKSTKLDYPQKTASFVF